MNSAVSPCHQSLLIFTQFPIHSLLSGFATSKLLLVFLPCFSLTLSLLPSYCELNKHVLYPLNFLKKAEARLFEVQGQDQMEGIVIERRITKWKNLKQRLGLRAMGCCGATWSPRARISTISILDENEDEEAEAEAAAAAARTQHVIRSRRSGNVLNSRFHNQTENSASVPLLVGQQQQQVIVPTSGTGMNLAMALAAERNLRGNNNNNNVVGPNPTEVKTLMRLIEETEGVDWTKKKTRKDKDNNNIDIVVNVEGPVVGGGGCDWMCCVCMERKKGAAFIPCGHTFCRVCSMEVRLNRGSCPVCNRSILDILHIF